MPEIDGEKLFDLLRSVFDKKDPDYKKWHQVGTLKPEDITRWKVQQSESRALSDEIELLDAKIGLIKQTAKVKGKEWWDHLHKTYSLPRDSGYHIADDGRILIQPDEEKGDCICGSCRK